MIDQCVRRSFRNSELLAKEATLLFHHKHYARSLFLALAALEEMGKCFLCLKAFWYPRTDKKRWHNFWRSFRHHPTKQRAVDFGLQTAAKTPWIIRRGNGAGYLLTLTNLKAAAEQALSTEWNLPGKLSDFEDLRQLCLYVDVYGGRVLEPAAIKRKDASEGLKSTQSLLQYVKGALRNADLPKLRKQIKAIRLAKS